MSKTLYKDAAGTKVKTAPERKDMFGCTRHDPFCEDCKYYSKAATCDYYFHTGHLRSFICPPSDKCTVKVIIKKKK